MSKMPDCDQGYDGDCCCNCEFQRTIRVCNCGKCSKVTGWICVIDVYGDYTCRHHEHEHGMCEMHRRREARELEE